MLPNPPTARTYRKWSVFRRWAEKISVGHKNGCWHWLGAKEGGGYGVMWHHRKRRRVLAHRLAYELFKGPIPHLKVIDHLCFNPACVNPDHLEAVWADENVKRMHRRKAELKLLSATNQKEL